MRIGINALYLIPGRVGGSEIYLRNLLSALSAVDRDNEYIVFTNRENSGTFEVGNNFREYHCPVRALSRPHRIVWEQLILPYRARQLKLDILHSPGFVAPLFSPCPSVVTILDLIYLSFPETFPKAARLWMRFLVAQSAKRSAAVIALSRYSRDEIMWELDIAWDKIRTIYMGVAPRNGAVIPRQDRIKVLRKYGVVLPFILTVAATHPHKNLGRLMEAYYYLLVKGSRYKLVIVGVKHNRHFQELQKMVKRLNLQEDVIFTGWVTEREKEIMYTEAQLIVFSSLLEGFGLPVLEAMSYGLPVACSDVPSLKEVAGEATYLFNPYSVAEITRALQECLFNTDLRGKLIEKGKIWAAQFTWERTARQTVDLYQNVVNRR